MMITLSSKAPPAAGSGFGPAVDDEYYALVHWIRSVGDASVLMPKAIGVTSCASGAGVSTVASSLAVAAARTTDRGVLLLDLSITRRRHSNRLAKSTDMSLPEALADTSQVCKSARLSPVPNLSLFSIDLTDQSEAVNVDSGKVNELLRGIEDDFGFIVVDLPPVDSSMCFVTVGSLDGVLLVMESERTHTETAIRAKQRLVDARATVLGVILNKHKQHLPSWLDRRL